jgi:ParB-like chromosome segregation protein Spo0J
MSNEKKQIPAAASKFVSLKAAAEDKEIEGIGKETSFKVDPRMIEIQPGFNRPISRPHVEQIKTSIRNGATVPPIFVRVDRGRVIMVDGEHRHIAVTELIAEGLEIPFMSAIQFRGSDADAIAHLLTSAQGEPISPLDQGIQYLKLMRLHWDVKMISARTGKSSTHIENCLMLAEANTDVQQSVRKGDIAGSTAVDLIREHGSDAGAVIQSELVKAKASGKNKVTRAGVQGRAIPRKLVARITSGIGSLFDTVPGLSAQELAAKPEGATVAVPAALLAELRAAHDEATKLRAAEAHPNPDESSDAHA